MKTALVMVPVLALALASCGDDGGGGSGNGVFDIDAEGSGPENVEPLWPIRSGSVNLFRAGAVRPPIEVAPGLVAYRYIAQPKTDGTDSSAQAQGELWLTVDEDGVWFEGAAFGGLLDAPLMLVPRTVRMGMRWTTGTDGIRRSYEVIRREEVGTPLGPTVVWVTEQQTDTPIYRTYAEGWGLIDISVGFENTLDPSSLFVGPIRAVLGTEPEAAQPTGPVLSLEPIPGFDEEESRLPERVDSVRAVRHGDGGSVMLLNIYGVQKNNFGAGMGVLGLRTVELEYRDGQLTEPTYTDMGSNRFLGGVPDAVYIPQEGIGQTYFDGPSGKFGIGNVLHVGSDVYFTVDDLLIFENELGGVSGAVLSFPYPRFEFRFERALFDPGYGQAGSYSLRPIWGTFPTLHYQFRHLLGDGATPASIPFAHVSGAMGALSHARLDAVEYGLLLDDPEFVEAFPDLAGTDLSGFRGPLISTTSSELGQVHLMTTPGGSVDRITVDTEGVRREHLGRVDLPENHSLRAAVQAADGTLLVFTYVEDASVSIQAAFVWTASPTAAPVRAEPAPFVQVVWTEWDARVCWPATGEPLDASGWRLGPAPAAAVIQTAANCALVVRDLEATPLPSELPLSGVPNGWGVFEGDVPGVGHLRAFEPNAGPGDGRTTYRHLAAASGAWLRGGGAIESFCPDSDTCVGRAYGRDGIARGTSPFMQFTQGAGVPDQTGLGMWLQHAVLELPDAHCGMGCSPDSFWAFVLSGPEPAIFPLSGLMPSSGGLMPVPTGGVVADAQAAPLAVTPHRGPIHLRPDGTYVEITLPDHYDSFTTSRSEALRVVRASGEVCGEGSKSAGPRLWDQYAWCSQPDGSGFREVRVNLAREGRALLVTGAGGQWQLLDDDTALVGRLGPSGGLATVDLDSLEVLPYPTPMGTPMGTSGALSMGADGVVYGSVQLSGSLVVVRGAFLPSGFVPLSEIYDVEALVEEGATGGEITSLLVMEDVVAIQHGSHVLRIPRTRWDGGTTCEPTTAPGLDADGDGYVADTSCGLDCDDSDPDVHPFVSDPCGDGIDSDCDGTPDSGMTCWEDADADGFAPAIEVALTVAECACPAGFTDREPTAVEFDCYDDDARMYPGQTAYFTTPSGAAEPFDFNCDGVVEERWTGDGACGADPDACTTTDGWNVPPGCGGASIYFGCAEPGMCGPRCARALVGSAFVCAAPGLPAALVLTQECR